MERAVAVKKLRKLLGKSFGYQIAKDAPTREEREAAKVELIAATKELDALRQKTEARRQDLLKADAQYQALIADCKIAQKRRDELLGKSHTYKFTVGTSNSLFFYVRAEGDSWEEVFEKLSKKERV